MVTTLSQLDAITKGYHGIDAYIPPSYSNYPPYAFYPDTTLTVTKSNKIRTPKPEKTVTFDKALAAIKRGQLVRRLTWHWQSKIGKMGDSIFVILPEWVNGSAPQKWTPYPNDILATDWAIVK